MEEVREGGRVHDAQGGDEMRGLGKDGRGE